MNHDTRSCQLQESGTNPSKYLRNQSRLKWQLPIMYGRHSWAAKDPSIKFGDVVGLLLGVHVLAGATPLPRPTEITFAFAVGHNICIERKACALVGSNSYYNEYIFATSSAASRLATPVEAEAGVAILTAKTAWGTCVFYVFNEGGPGCSKTPSFPESGEKALQCHFCHHVQGCWIVKKYLEAANKVG